jgi:hypothetical protein
MHHNYQNRKDISVLLIEKNLRPEGPNNSVHNIISTGDFLSEYGFNVDMVWNIKEHDFGDFDEFMRKNKSIIEGRLSNIKDYIVRQVIGENIPSYDLLRMKPINSIDDLASYKFILAHPEDDDYYTLLEFAKRYHEIPLIFPDNAENISQRPLRQEIIPGVIRDKMGVYILEDEDVSYKTLELIEHLLDQTKA